MHEKTKRFLEKERENLEQDLKEYGKLNGDKEFIKARYLREFNFNTNVKRISGVDNGEKYLADEIVKMMKGERMTFNDGCVMLGYISKLLRLDDEYRSGIDIEEYYIKECLSEEHIILAKNIVNYIQTQEEVYAYIPATLDFVYETLKLRLININIW